MLIDLTIIYNSKPFKNFNSFTLNKKTWTHFLSGILHLNFFFFNKRAEEESQLQLKYLDRKMKDHVTARLSRSTTHPIIDCHVGRCISCFLWRLPEMTSCRLVVFSSEWLGLILFLTVYEANVGVLKWKMYSMHLWRSLEHMYSHTHVSGFPSKAFWGFQACLRGVS